MDQKGFSEGYKKDILRYLKPVENEEIQGITELREIVSGSSSSMALTVFRAYVNFLLDTEIITEEDAIYFRKALPSRKTNPVGYVPNDSDVKKAYENIKSKKDRLLFQILALSGIRVTEPVKMLRDYEPSKLITDNEISKYLLNYIRENKRSQYVYMPTDLSMKLHRFYIRKDTVSYNLNSLVLTPRYLIQGVNDILLLLRPLKLC
jgi:intergrase/recombinase